MLFGKILWRMASISCVVALFAAFFWGAAAGHSYYASAATQPTTIQPYELVHNCIVKDRHMVYNGYIFRYFVRYYNKDLQKHCLAESEAAFLDLEAGQAVLYHEKHDGNTLKVWFSYDQPVVAEKE